MSSDLVVLQPSAFGLGTGDSLRAITGSKTSGPGGVEAIFEYNGLYMNVREWVDTYVVTTIDGIDDADVRDTREINPGSHGETPGNAFYGGRTIVLSGYIQTKTLWKMRDMQQALRQSFSRIDRELPLIIRPGASGVELAIWCKKSQKLAMSETQQTMNSFRRDFQIMLRASNPRFLANARTRSVVGFASTLTDFRSPIQTLESNFGAAFLSQYPQAGGGYESVNGLLIPKSFHGIRNLFSNPGFNNGDLTDWEAIEVESPIVTSQYEGTAPVGGQLEKNYHFETDAPTSEHAEEVDGWLKVLWRENPEKVTPGSKISTGMLVWVGGTGADTYVSLKMSWFKADGTTPSDTPLTDSEIEYDNQGDHDRIVWEGIDVPADAHYAQLEVWAKATADWGIMLFAGDFMMQDKATLDDYFDGETDQHLIGPTVWEGEQYLSPSRKIRKTFINYAINTNLAYDGLSNITMDNLDGVPRDDGTFKYIRASVIDPGEGSMWIENNPAGDGTGDNVYSMGLWLRKTRVTPRAGSLEFDFFSGGDPLHQESMSLSPLVNQQWRFYKFENVESDPAANGFLAAMILEALATNENIDIRDFIVVKGEELPVEGYFDGESPWSAWVAGEGPAMSYRPHYIQATTTRKFTGVTNTVGFYIPDNPNGDAENSGLFDSYPFDVVRVYATYIDDRNGIYAELDGNGLMRIWQEVDGVREAIDSGGYNHSSQMTPGSTHYFRVRSVSGWVTAGIVKNIDPDVDPYYGVGGQTTGFGQFSDEEIRKYFKTPIATGFVVASNYAGFQIKSWRFEDADTPDGFEKFAGPAHIYVKNGRLRQLTYASTGISLRRSDLVYPITDVELTVRHCHPAHPFGFQTESVTLPARIIQWGSFGATRCLYGRLTKNYDGTAELSVGYMDDNLPAFGTELDSVAVDAGDNMVDTPAWLRFIVQGNELTAEHWTEEPSEEGSPAATVTYELDEPETEDFAAGTTGDVGLMWYVPVTESGTPPSGSWLDSYKTFLKDFDSIAFNIVNFGNFPAQPEIYLHGPMADLVIVNEVNDQAIVLNTEIPDDEVWVIDVARNQMFREFDGESRFDALDETSELIELEPGVNPIRVITSGLKEQSQIEFFHRNTYI